MVGGDAAARATPNNTRPHRRTAARARYVVGIQDGGGGGGVSINAFWWGYREEGGVGCKHQCFLNSLELTPSIIYFNCPICDCSAINTFFFNGQKLQYAKGCVVTARRYLYQQKRPWFYC